MGKLKYTLISLLAVCLTAGGVFAAWTFSDANYNSSENVDIDVNSGFLPADRYEFNEVQITFHAGQDGTYSDGTKERSFTNMKSQSLDLDKYNNLFQNLADFPSIKDGQGNITHYFSHWIDANEINDDGYHFDEALSRDTTLVAQYVSADSPVICKLYPNGDIEELAYFRINTNSEGGVEEYQVNNFVVSSDDRNSWGNQEENPRDYKYIVKHGSSDPEDYIYTLNTLASGVLETINGMDYIYNGLYTVFYRPNGSTSDSWKLYGGRTFFQRDYNFEIVGTPAGNWDINSPSAPKFGYVKTENNKKTYKIDKVYFPKSTKMPVNEDGSIIEKDDASREFKIASPYFNASYGLCHTSPNSTYKHTYAWDDSNDVVDTGDYLTNSANDNKANLKIVSDYEYFEITIEVSYESISDFYHDNEASINTNFYVFGNIPNEIKITLKPYEYAIHYLNKDGLSIYETEYVMIGNQSEKYNEIVPTNDEPAEWPSKGWKVKTWLDRDTNQEIDFSGLSITKNYFVKPTYEVSDQLVSTKNLYIYSYDTSTKSFVQNSLQVFDGGTVQDSIDYYRENNITTYDSTIALLNYTSSDYVTFDSKQFTFDGFAKDSINATSKTALSTITNNPLQANTSYYMRFGYDKVLYYYGESNKHNYLYHNNSASTASWSRNKGYNNQSQYVYYGKRVLGINEGLDRISTNVTQVNVKTNVGRYYFRYTNNAWDIKRVLCLNVIYCNGWWRNENVNTAFVYYWSGSQNTKAAAQDFKWYDSPQANIGYFLLPFDYTNLLFYRSDNVNGGWKNKSQDIDLINDTNYKKSYSNYVFRIDNTSNEMLYGLFESFSGH